MKKLFRLAPCLLACLFILSTPSWAAPATKPGEAIPTNIKASRMEYNAAKQQVVFTGKVHVNRPDFQVWSEKLTVYMKKGTQKESDSQGGVDSLRAGDIDKIVAEKNVIIKSEGKEAKSDIATYTIQTAVFKLEGSPVLREKENSIRGHTIYHFMNENRSEVVGAVEANFMAPDSSKNKKK